MPSHALSSILRRAPAIQIRPVLAPTLAVHCAERLDACGLVTRVRKQQRNDAVRRHARGGEVPDRGAVVGVRPQVLRSKVNQRGPAETGGGGRTRTEYCRPARIQGDSVRLKNMSAGSLSVLNCPPRAGYSQLQYMGRRGGGERTSMKTVPFWLGPLQYCAGKVLLLVQSGCTSPPRYQISGEEGKEGEGAR